jgi:hypothetical protein
VWAVEGGIHESAHGFEMPIIKLEYADEMIFTIHCLMFIEEEGFDLLDSQAVQYRS